VNLDLRADLHGHALDWLNDQDRRWFREHPGATWYAREPCPHELCDPRFVPRCEPLLPSEYDDVQVMIQVEQIAPGVRVRSFYARRVVA
jgi:hypothetical protein